MSLTVNGVDIARVVANGIDMVRAYANGIHIFSKANFEDKTITCYFANYSTTLNFYLIGDGGTGITAEFIFKTSTGDQPTLSGSKIHRKEDGTGFGSGTSKAAGFMVGSSVRIGFSITLSDAGMQLTSLYQTTTGSISAVLPYDAITGLAKTTVTSFDGVVTLTLEGDGFRFRFKAHSTTNPTAGWSDYMGIDVL